MKHLHKLTLLPQLPAGVNLNPHAAAGEAGYLIGQVHHGQVNRMGHIKGMGQLQDPQKVRRARKDLARLMTVRRETELTAGRKGER